jgi:hypothetical protein
MLPNQRIKLYSGKDSILMAAAAPRSLCAIRRARRETFVRTGRDNKLACQIGEFLVCAELGRQGLIATPFAGNVPTFDVLVADELCRTLPIQVKTTRSDNWPSDARKWMKIDFDASTGRQNYLGPATLGTPDLVYVCAALATSDGITHGPDRFFVLTEADLQEACIRCYSSWMQHLDWRRPRNPQSYDCRWSIPDVQRFENNWPLITTRLAASSPHASLVARR